MVSPNMKSMLHIRGKDYKGELRPSASVIQSIKLLVINIIMLPEPELILIRLFYKVWPCHLHIIVNKATTHSSKLRIVNRCTMGNVLHLQTYFLSSIYLDMLPLHEYRIHAPSFSVRRH